MIECPRCGVKIDDDGLTSMEPVSCPTCGYSIQNKASGKSSIQGTEIIKNYFSDIWKILVHPQSFFRHMPVSGGIAKPLTFALVTHWLGSALGFIWNISLGGSIFTLVQKWLEEDISNVDYPGRNVEILAIKTKVMQWVTGAGPVIADPFFTLVSIFFTSFLLFLGVRIFVTSDRPGEITFETSLRIICFGMTASILSVIPLMGSMVATFYALILTVIGVKEVYRISTGRALVIALFPKLVIPGIIGLGFLIMVIGFIKFIMTSF
jgi:hypothetical protein